jgi:DNA-binding transcriptional ArsR family regulator
VEARVTELTKIFKALSDPKRLAIFQLVRDCGKPEGCSDAEVSDNLSQIAERFGLSLSTVSHHVRELRNSGLITCEKRGQQLHCWVDQDALKQLADFAKGNGAGG